MATDAERRAQLRNAFSSEARRRGVTVPESVVDLFVDRALAHINSRFKVDANRDAQVAIAIENVDTVVKNLSGFAGRSVTLSESRQFIQRQVDCVYPWCRPE